MNTNLKGQLIPIKTPENGRWVSPDVAATYFKKGKGITKKRMMNRIYAGMHNGFVKRDHLGNWWVFIPDTYSSYHPLKAA
jgi:hypothetical protein